jgi:hypothetical protein
MTLSTTEDAADTEVKTQQGFFLCVHCVHRGEEV